VSAPRHCATHSCTAGAPHPRKRTVEPTRGDGRPFCTRMGPCHDVGRVPSVHRQPCAAIPATTAPSEALQRHPRRCGSARRQDIATPAAVLRTASGQLPPRVNTRATTERKTPTPPPLKPLLDGYRTRHDVLPKARFVRTVVYSTALHTMPSHVDKTVWHACKLPPP
jgi:hypothetical protein